MVKLCIVLLFVLDFVNGQGKDPCLTATLINDTRRQVDNNQTSDLCDRLLQPGFYRFQNAEIPFSDSCIDDYHCGTHKPVWIQGNNYPKVSDGLQARNICVNVVANDNNCCDYSKEIAVKNCGSYFVYYLRPTPGCSMAYCTEKACSGPKYSKTGLPPCTDAYPILTKNPVLSNPIVTTNDFEFKCHVPYPPNKHDATFEVTWLIDGRPTQSIPKQTIFGGQRDVTLQGGSLYGHINSALSCSVVSTFTDQHTGGLKSPPQNSNEYFVGIQISHSKITVGDKLPDQQVFVTSTIPIVCRHQAQQTCALIFTVTTDNENVSPSTCHLEIKHTGWNPITNTAQTSFFINTSPTFTATSSSTSHVHFGVNTVPGWEWSGLKVPNITVVSTANRHGAQCKSVGDPHYFTFDNHFTSANKRFSNFHVGQFTLVKQKRGSFQVESRTWKKPGGRASLNCAVAAREGNDVIIVDMCDGPYEKTYPKLKIQNPAMFENKTEIVKDRSGNVFVIKFKSGAVVKVHLRNLNCLDVFISVPGTFAGDTTGLCGTFDGNYNNDLQRPNGHIDAVSRYPYSFIDSWRIPTGTSLFEKAEPLPAKNTRKDFCTCNKQTNKQECNNNHSAMPPISAFCTGCTAVDPVPFLPPTTTPPSVWVTMPPPVAQTTYIFPPPSQPPQQTAVISRPTATMYCFDVMNKYPSAQKCIHDVYQMGFTEIVDMCVNDIELTGDKDMGLSALTTMMEGCGFNSLIKPSNIVNGTFVTPPEAKVCPGACSGNGECNNGVCTCVSGFESSDCSVNKTKLPSITDISGGSACDSQSGDCRKPVVLGENMNYQKTACKIRGIHFSQFGSSTVDMTSSVVLADFMSTSHVACPLPKDPYNSDGAALKGYMMSLTNNGGSKEGNTQVYYIYNSTCMECDQLGSCSVKSGTCMIENKCYVNGDHDNRDNQGWCIPTVSNTQWTKQSPTTTATPLPTTTAFLPPSSKASQGSGALNNYTAVGTGCGCYFDTTSTDCACCKNYGCPCDATSRHVCFDCMTPDMCHH